MVFHFGKKSVAFNTQWVASKSLEEFSEHEKHHELSEAQYQEVWDCCREKECVIDFKMIEAEQVTIEQVEEPEEVKPKRKRKSED